MIADNRLPFFHCFPGKLLGAIAGMTPDQALVYMVVLLRIYEVRGPCPDGVEVLGRRIGINKRRVSDALAPLFQGEEPKLVRRPGGIMNPFAERILADGDALHARLSRAGAVGGSRGGVKKRVKSSDEPKPCLAPAEAGPKQLNLEVVPESLRGDSGAGVPAVVEDVRTKLFRSGLATLSRISGKPVDASRRMIGRWLRESLDDAVAVLRAIEDADRNRIADPVPWIVAALRGRSGGTPAASGRYENGWAHMLREGMEEITDGTATDARRPTVIDADPSDARHH